MPQLWAAWKLIAFVEACAAGGSSAFRIAVRGIPGFAVYRLNGIQLFLCECLIHRRKFLGNESVELAGGVFQFFLQ